MDKHILLNEPFAAGTSVAAFTKMQEVSPVSVVNTVRSNVTDRANMYYAGQFNVDVKPVRNVSAFMMILS